MRRYQKVDMIRQMKDQPMNMQEYLRRQSLQREQEKQQQKYDKQQEERRRKDEEAIRTQLLSLFEKLRTEVEKAVLEFNAQNPTSAISLQNERNLCIARRNFEGAQRALEVVVDSAHNGIYCKADSGCSRRLFLTKSDCGNIYFQVEKEKKMLSIERLDCVAFHLLEPILLEPVLLEQVLAPSS
jgi:hypothetical protein